MSGRSTWNFRWVLVLGVMGLLAPARLGADTFYPMVMGIRPVAVQISRSTECEVSARYNLHGAYQVLVTGEGVVAEVDPPAKAEAKKPQVGKLKFRCKVAADARPGPRDVRIVTPQGASTLGQVVVVRDPIVRETAASNDTLKTAQAITLPAAVCGAIEKPEDVDYYKFSVAAGTALTFHVWGQRLEDKIHELLEHVDPILTLRNSAGTVLAVNDNYFHGDPLLHYRFATAGEYFLEIRDVRYGGSPDWLYCIEINDRPFVTNAYPSCVAPGTTTRLSLVGPNLPAGATAPVTVPSTAADGLHWATLSLAPAGGEKPGQALTNPVPIIVSRLPLVLEMDGDHASAATTQKIPVPAGVCGRIAKEGEIDCYAFEAKAGERFTFEVVARQHQSLLDSHLRILGDKGNRLAENDDASDRYVRADSLLENWTSPAAGRYVIALRDLHLRGGPEFVYFLRVTRSEPGFVLELDTDKTLLAPGSGSPIFVRATRKNGFAGEVQLHVEGLPAGVTACCGRVLTGEKDGCIVLRAGTNAARGAANVRVTGSATHVEGGKTLSLTASARPLQEIYMPGGGRWHYPAQMHTVSVGDPLDLKSVKISPASVVLRPGEAKKIDVTIERSEGFKANVTLDAVYQHLGYVFGGCLPPGVTIDDKASLTLLTGDKSAGFLTLKAAPDAKPVKEQQVPIMAHVSINFVMKFTYCAEPLLVSVSK
jgi:hypothetical protein